jgi:hypothetical protein
MRRYLVLPFAVVLIGVGATSQPARDLPPTYACVRADGAIEIDGAINDVAWKGALWTEDFIDIVGSSGKEPPALRTRAKLLWDDQNLYVAAELTEPRIAATIRQRDEQLYREQAFEMFIDPDGDGKNYLELQINPLNTVCDLAMDKPYRDKGKANVAFNVTGQRSAVRVKGTLNDSSDVDESWTVELAIPWAALKGLARDTVAPPPAGERWRVNLARMRAADPAADGEPKSPKSISVWAAQGAVNMHLPERWGFLELVASRPATPDKVK